MKVEDKPIWYDVYAAFPPQLEPRFDRPAPKMNIKQIFYEEDVIRAYELNVLLDLEVEMIDVRLFTENTIKR